MTKKVKKVLQGGRQLVYLFKFYDSDGKLVIMGNLNPAGVLLTGSPGEVYAEACERIKTANGRGQIIAPGCDMGADTPKQNVMMMLKACEECR